MTDGLVWPLIVLVRFDIRRSPLRRRLRDVEPMFSRSATTTWAAIYAERACENPALKWFSAGFVRCHRDKLDATLRALRRVCAETNAQFAEAIVRGLIPGANDAWMELECISAASFDPKTDAYRGTYADGR